jgi:hypothetical protein
MSDVASAITPVITASISSRFAGKDGKYTLSLTNPRKKRSSGQPLKVVKLF